MQHRRHTFAATLAGGGTARLPVAFRRGNRPSDFSVEYETLEGQLTAAPKISAVRAPWLHR